MFHQFFQLPGIASFAVYAVVLSFFASLIFGFGRKKSEDGVKKTVIVPSSLRAQPRSGAEIRDALMIAARRLEASLDRMSAGGVREDERKWQNKMRAEIDGIKRSIDAGDYRRAKRHLSGAELCAKMLELHIASR